MVTRLDSRKIFEMEIAGTVKFWSSEGRQDGNPGVCSVLDKLGVNNQSVGFTLVEHS